MWIYKDDKTKLANIIVRSKLKDGVLKFFQLYPCEGYVLRIPIFDEYEIDEEGNFVYDGNGNKILINTYRTNGGAVVEPDYNWVENKRGFCAEIYSEDMNVR